MLVSAACLLAIATSGTGLTWWISDRLRLEERIAVGAIVGAFSVAAVSFVAFELVGMGWGSLGTGIAVPAIAGIAGFAGHRAQARAEVASAWRRLRLPVRARSSLQPLVAVSVASGLVTTRTLALAYQSTTDGLSVGSLAVWGDWSAHLAYAGSFAYGDNRGLDLPTAAGTPFRYHFLADFFASLFTVSGATLQQSLILGSWLLAIAFPVVVWCAVRRLTGSERVSAVTMVLFTLSGGVGWWYFLRDLADDGWDIVGTLPQTYARIPDVHLWVDNTISASLYAQRSTLMGMCAAFAALIVVLASRPHWSRRGFASAGLLIGATGITDVHVLLSGLALAALAWWLDRRREWAWFMASAAVGLPLVWMLRPETNSMRWLLGWMAPAAHQPWPWFWLRNVGVLLPIYAGISLFGGVPQRLRRLTAPLWLWFVVPNLVAFHPSEWNNTKFFLFWQFGGSLVVASWLVDRWTSPPWRTASGKRWARVGLASCSISLVAAGGLDAVRGMQRSAAIPWVADDDLAAATWLRTNSQPDDIIVYGATNTSAVAALGGRRSVTGYVGWTYDLGLTDWAERRTAVTTILSGGAGTADAIARYGVSYVVIGPTERQEDRASDSYWETHGTLVFASGEHRIFRTPAG